MYAHFHVPSYICNMINRFLQFTSKKILECLKAKTFCSHARQPEVEFLHSPFLGSGFTQMFEQIVFYKSEKT